MANAKEVKNRIKSVKNISQITRALEAVSASRVRRAQDRVNASRAYAEKAWEILINVQNASKGTLPHPLLQEREEVNAALVVVITSDRGLAGAYNSNVLRVATDFERRFGKDVKYITIGKKGRDTLIRQGKDIIAEFSDMPAQPTIADISPISQLAIDEFLSGNVDEVLIAYTDFINMLTQRPVILPWLPLTPNSEVESVAQEYFKEQPDVSESAQDYEYEPNVAAVIDEIVPRFTELQLFQALLEAQASEHAARMTAMRNATDNASGLVDDLTLEYNKARQAAITNEILDIVGGAAALEDAHSGAAKVTGDSDSSNGNGKRRTKRRSKKRAPKSEAASVDTTPADVSADDPAPVTIQDTADNNDPDDLTKVEGIGPKMSRALIDSGISTYVKLANSSNEDLQQAIEDAGMRLAPSLDTWAEQAEYLVNGDMDGLQAFQDTLVAGRRPDSDN